MKKSLVTFVSAVILFAALIQEVSAQEKYIPEKKGLKEKLNLTDVQEKQISEMKYNHEKRALDVRNEIKKNRLEIKNMIANNEVDEALFMNITKKNSDLQAELKEMKAEHWLNVYDILDTNQKKIWAEGFLRRGRKPDFHHERGHSRRGGPGKGDFSPERGKRDFRKGFN